MDYQFLKLTLVGMLMIGQSFADVADPQDCKTTVCTAEYDPQCGSNHVTYSNPCTFKVAQCSDVSIQVAYAGECKDAEKACEDMACTQEYNPQCGNNGRTFSNPCTLMVAQCSDVKLQLAHKGECDYDDEPCAWIVCTQDYDPVCGSDGVTYSNKCKFEARQCEINSLYVAYKGSCKNDARPLSVVSGGKAAKDPHHATVKAGFCPAVNLGQFGTCVKECNVDTDCMESHHKCCDSGCSKLCLPARVSKPGVCPAASHSIDDECEDLDFVCDSDVECLHAQKCCFDGCHSVCVDPQPREGFCPMVPSSEPIGVCVNNCTHDHQCPFPQKCCTNGCGYLCVAPEVPKEGLCAPVSETEGFGACMSLCFRDSECEGEEKCCSNGCGHTCQEPEWGTCEKDFRKYHNNETKLDVNNCDECTCRNGTLECTERDCYCEYKGRTYESGHSFSAKDGCNKCHCFGLKVICTDFICRPNLDESKKILGIVLGCVFGALTVVLIVAVALAVSSALKKKKKNEKTPKNVPHSRAEAEQLPAKV